MVVTAPGGAWLPALPKIAGALVAGIVAFLTHSQLKTLGSGMLTLWVLQALAPRFG
jgi:branched-subunit amino acid transport protein